jgi:hypothetical protein
MTVGKPPTPDTGNAFRHVATYHTGNMISLLDKKTLSELFDMTNQELNYQNDTQLKLNFFSGH